MTVNELIEFLSDCNQETEIHVSINGRVERAYSMNSRYTEEVFIHDEEGDGRFEETLVIICG